MTTNLTPLMRTPVGVGTPVDVVVIVPTGGTGGPGSGNGTPGTPGTPGPKTL